MTNIREASGSRDLGFGCVLPCTELSTFTNNSYDKQSENYSEHNLYKSYNQCEKFNILQRHFKTLSFNIWLAMEQAIYNICTPEKCSYQCLNTPQPHQYAYDQNV